MWPSGNWTATPQPSTILYPKDFGRLDKPRDMGPVAIGDPSEGLSTYEWEMESNDTHFLLGRVGQPKTTLVAETGVLAADLSFDQAGRAFIAYEKAAGVYAYWYDPVAQDFVLQQISAGATNPFCTLDMRDPSQNDSSDILVFYERADAIYYRISSDRYSVEYATPVTSLAGKKIDRCGIGANKRFVLVYKEVD